MRPRLLLILVCTFLPQVVIAETRGIDVAVSIDQHKIDFNYSGAIRETRLSSLELSWVEKLAPSVYGGIELAHLEFTQYSNPIAAGQTGSGGYLGLHVSFILIDTMTFELLTRVGYRYSEAGRTIEGQTVDWDWHQGRLDVLGKWRVSQQLALVLGGSAITIDGRERAEGTVTQAQPFKANKPVSGAIGMQFGLDRAGMIGIEIETGSLRGGRVTFRRVF